MDSYLQYVGGSTGAIALTGTIAAASALYYATRPTPEKPLVPLDNQSPILEVSGACLIDFQSHWMESKCMGIALDWEILRLDPREDWNLVWRPCGCFWNPWNCLPQLLGSKNLTSELLGTVMWAFKAEKSTSGLRGSINLPSGLKNFKKFSLRASKFLKICPHCIWEQQI